MPLVISRICAANRSYYFRYDYNRLYFVLSKSIEINYTSRICTDIKVYIITLSIGMKRRWRSTCNKSTWVLTTMGWCARTGAPIYLLQTEKCIMFKKKRHKKIIVHRLRMSSNISTSERTSTNNFVLVAEEIQCSKGTRRK